LLRVNPSDWMRLKMVVPEEYWHLCDLCHKFLWMCIRLTRSGVWIEGKDVGMIYDFLPTIVAEYLKVVRMAGAKDDVIKKIKEDIGVTMSRFFERQGRLKDLGTELLTIERRGKEDLSFFIPAFLAPLIAFVNSRIYDSLVEAYNKCMKNFPIQFNISTCNKAGILYEPFTREELGLPPVSRKRKEE